MKFHKYQALGNDYLVLELPDEALLTPAQVRRICDRQHGVGSDGILLGRAEGQGFGLRILNPDASEAEKSGNGLRIFARYLWDQGRVGAAPFPVVTKGGTVTCQVRDGGRAIFVEMGEASFDSAVIPVAGPRREVVGEWLDLPGERVRFTAVSVGNPHCVVHVDEVSGLARRLGPLLETHALFPNRTNVQFVKVLDAHRIQIEIWERGAGNTLASGSSSCAAAAASVRLGRCAAGEISVLMPGGTLAIGVGADFSLTMLGPARQVAEGTLSRELFEDAGTRSPPRKPAYDAAVPRDPADAALADTLAHARVDSIPDVIARMREVDALLPDTDGLKWFNFLYLMVTEEIGRDVAAARWADGRWLEQLDVVFARLYFEAVVLWIRDPPRCPRAWGALFEARRRRGIARVQFGIAGMNAHINRDLPLAVVRACEATQVTPQRGTAQHADYERVNQILEDVEIRAMQRMATGIIARVSDGLGRLDDVLAMWKVRKARDGAWSNAEVQWALRGLPQVASHHLAAMDRMAGFAGRAVLVPTEPSC